VTIRTGDQVITSFEVSDSTQFTRRIDVPASIMGDGEWLELVIEVSGVVIPKEMNPQVEDDRHLGLQVFLLYLSSSS